jgi:CRISPR-associated protein Cas2
MDLLVTYDVNTLSAEGRRRLRKVARACLDYGQRVQESVFECKVNEMQRELLLTQLLSIIEPKEDSLRVYLLRGGRDGAVSSYGLDRYVDFAAPLVS